MSSNDLSGKVVLIVGVLGETTTMFARGLSAAGGSVAVATPEEGSPPSSGEFEVIPASLEDDAGMEILREHVVSSIGSPAVLVNHPPFDGHADAMSLASEAWANALDRTLSTAFRCSRAFASGMRDGRGGAIVNVLPIDAFHGYPHRAAQAAASSGLLGLTRVLAVEWAPFGIRVNALAPGLLETGGRQAALDAEPGARERLEARIPLGRLGSLEEAAAALLFLSGGRSKFMTGQVLRVDGGWTALASAVPELIKRYQADLPP